MLPGLAASAQQVETRGRTCHKFKCSGCILDLLDKNSRGGAQHYILTISLDDSVAGSS